MAVDGHDELVDLRWTLERFGHADGTSHVRALAFQSTFVLVSGMVGLVGLASLLDWQQLRDAVQELVAKASPGISARLLQQALHHGSSGGGAAAAIGLGAALVSGTLAMDQIRRSADRLHGIDADPPPIRRYGSALALALVAGLPLAVGGLVLGGGRSIATGAGWQGAAMTTWLVLRWPLGLALAALAIGLMFRLVAPGQPSRRDVALGTLVALVLWATFTSFLGLYLSLSSTSQSVYGPLLAVIAILLWSAATSLALHVGLAVIASRRGARDDQVSGRGGCHHQGVSSTRTSVTHLTHQ